MRWLRGGDVGLLRIGLLTIPIICTTPACGGMIALADREVLHAFEIDVLVNWGDAEVWCVKTYPKAAWARFEAVEVVSGTSH